MGVFTRIKFRSAADANSFATRYRQALRKHHFLLFGLPFLTIIVGASFVLTPATAIRYERYDRKVRQLSTEEVASLRQAPKQFDIRQEYFKLAAKDHDNWEQKRIKRLPGESDGEL